MGLLDLFLQNTTTLDVDPTPSQGNGPVGTPTGEFNTGAEPFQQVWDSSNTYMNSFIGSTNTGIQPPTLAETGLDVDDPTFVPSTATPNTLTLYPATAKGSLGQGALQFLQIWNPVISYNDVVAGAPTSPLQQSLSETGLDNTDESYLGTTTSPLPVNVPVLPQIQLNNEVLLAPSGSVSQFVQKYSPSNRYLDIIDALPEGDT